MNRKIVQLGGNGMFGQERLIYQQIGSSESLNRAEENALAVVTLSISWRPNEQIPRIFPRGMRD
jgi:hypothetical protein